MARLIDADALLKKKDIITINDGNRASVVGIVYEDDIEEAPTIDAVPKWIPCSERLPEPVAPSQRREWFVTSNQYGCVTLTCYEFEASPFKEGWQTDMTILAWMPLPEPYKMDGKEQEDE